MPAQRNTEQPGSSPRRLRARAASFRLRIVLALGAVAVAPVLLLGWTSFALNRDELRSAVGGAHARTAVELARSCDRFVQDGVRSVQLAAAYIPFSALRRDELRAALAIPYRQLPALDAIVLLDPAGAAVAPPVRHPDPGADPALAGHEGVDDAALEAFARHVPFDAALAAPAAVGPPYRAPGTGAPRVAIAIRVDRPARHVLAAELSLGDVGQRLAALSESGDAGVLVDARGDVVAGLPPGATLSADERALVRAGTAGGAPAVQLVRRGDGQRWLAAYAGVPSLGWGLLVMQQEAQAFRAAERVRHATTALAVAALAVAALIGLVLARGLSGPVSSLSAAARALRDGRYGERVVAAGGEELAALADAFNHMADEVQRRDDEIRRWNAELHGRVEQQTAELRAAQEQIARTRRLAALASLGAGFAHGINNAMTSLIGLVTLARTRVEPRGEAGQLLGAALEEAGRVTRIVQDVRELSESERREAGTRFSLERAVLDVVERRRAALDERRIAVKTAMDPGLPAVQGVPEQIGRVLEQLVDNAAAAMPGGGTLEVTVSSVDGQALKLCVADTGVGIPPEHRERIFDPFFTTRATAGAGLGLSLAHGIVEAHHGRIQVESAPGKGSRFTVLLPAAAPEAHLS